MKENINENNTFTKYNDLKVEALKSNFGFDLLNIDKDFNPTFILSCYEVFFRISFHIAFYKSDNINSIEGNFFIEAFKNLDKIDNLYFFFEKNNNDNYNFKFSYNKENKEIFYLKGVCKDNCLFTIEEFFKLPDTKFLFFQNPNPNLNFGILNDSLFKSGLEDFKIISKYDNNIIINKSPLYKTIESNNINYLLEDNLDKNLFNRYYFYNDDLILESIMYVLLRDEYFIKFHYDLDKKIYERTPEIPEIKGGKKNLSATFVDYLKITNKKAEDINEDDLNVISMLNY